MRPSSDHTDERRRHRWCIWRSCCVTSTHTLPKTERERLESIDKSIGEFLSEHSFFGPRTVEGHSQGSMAIRTTTRPEGKAEFGVDVVARLYAGARRLDPMVLRALLAVYKPAGLTNHGARKLMRGRRPSPAGSRRRGSRGRRSPSSWWPWCCWAATGRTPIPWLSQRAAVEIVSRALDLAIGARFKMAPSMKRNSQQPSFCGHWPPRRCAGAALR